jgi:hypothetical protein
MTAVGYRPFPQQSEIAMILGGPPPHRARPPPGPIGELPALITADWCPFTVQATRFWQNAAAAAGLALRVLDAESDEGGRVMDAAQVAGVPCAIAATGERVYGYQHTPLEAERFLLGSARPEESSS